MSSSTSDNAQFHVGLGAHLFSGAITGFPSFWQLMGRLESLVLSEQLEHVEVERPVYVAGLARAGTTILLEILATHPDVVTHRYSDFPALFTPYWWGKANQHSTTAPTERAHGDGLMVTNQSPEAMEEMLWMSCFENLHNSSISNVLGKYASNEKFESLYREHIRKLLLLRGGSRYVAKGNYNLTRIGYLHKLFSGATFLIPIRNPVNHIASLMKQHRLFCNGENNNPRAVAHMQRVGHFEFGLDRRPINIGDSETVSQIIQLWASGEEVRGWAKYWAMIYGWLAEYLATNDDVKNQVRIVRYEDLCSAPLPTLEHALAPSGLWNSDQFAGWAERIKQPSYYRVEFDQTELTIIREETRAVCDVFGYSEFQQ